MLIGCMFPALVPPPSPPGGGVSGNCGFCSSAMFFSHSGRANSTHAATNSAHPVITPKCALNSCIYRKLCVRGIQEIIAQKRATLAGLGCIAKQAELQRGNLVIGQFCNSGK